jgi:hypothetical protein
MRGECTDPDDAYIYIEQLWPATTHTHSTAKISGKVT